MNQGEGEEREEEKKETESGDGGEQGFLTHFPTPLLGFSTFRLFGFSAHGLPRRYLRGCAMIVLMTPSLRSFSFVDRQERWLELG